MNMLTIPWANDRETCKLYFLRWYQSLVLSRIWGTYQLNNFENAGRCSEEVVGVDFEPVQGPLLLGWGLCAGWFVVFYCDHGLGCHHPSLRGLLLTSTVTCELRCEYACVFGAKWRATGARGYHHHRGRYGCLSPTLSALLFFYTCRDRRAARASGLDSLYIKYGIHTYLRILRIYGFLYILRRVCTKRFMKR